MDFHTSFMKLECSLSLTVSLIFLLFLIDFYQKLLDYISFFFRMARRYVEK